MSCKSHASFTHGDRQAVASLSKPVHTPKVNKYLCLPAEHNITKHDSRRLCCNRSTDVYHSRANGASGRIIHNATGVYITPSRLTLSAVYLRIKIVIKWSCGVRPCVAQVEHTHRLISYLSIASSQRAPCACVGGEKQASRQRIVLGVIYSGGTTGQSGHRLHWAMHSNANA